VKGFLQSSARKITERTQKKRRPIQVSLKIRQSKERGHRERK
jgi:hypothetical protein